jgi:hypothetical protein
MEEKSSLEYLTYKSQNREEANQASKPGSPLFLLSSCHIEIQTLDCLEVCTIHLFGIMG